MKIKEGISRTEYDPESTIEVTHSKFLSWPLQQLDLFIGFLKTRTPDKVTEITDVLLYKMRNIDVESKIIDPVCDYEAQNLDEYPELEEALQKVSLGILNFKKQDEDSAQDKVTIPFTNYLKSYVPANYMMLASMVEVLGREIAVNLYKEFVDYRTDELNLLGQFETLSDFYNAYFIMEKGPNGVLSCLLEDGKMIARVNQCSWQKILEPFGDPELAYLTSCYYDFHAAKVMNPNFKLTRTKTLMQGDELCDFCWHDNRLDDSMNRPPDDFWDHIQELK
jgi:hypothetical protein